MATETTNKTEHQCEARGCGSDPWGLHRCTNNAKFFEGGEWLCGIHAPSKIEAREQAKKAREQAYRAARIEREKARIAERKAQETPKDDSRPANQPGDEVLLGIIKPEAQTPKADPMTTHPTNLTPADGVDDYLFFFQAIETHLGFAKKARDEGRLDSLKIQAEFIRMAAGGLKDTAQKNLDLQPEPGSNVRPERTFQAMGYRGIELAKAIKAMWARNEAIQPGTPGRTETVNRNIKAILDEYDLTIPEWHYWADIARKG